MASSGPTLAHLQARLSNLLPRATKIAHIGYRACTPKYSTDRDLLTGEGSKLYGGRWNPPGIPVVYISLSPETAMAETLAQNRYYGIPIEDAMPRVFVAIEARLNRVLDLRVGRNRQSIGVSQTRILTVDWRKELQEGRQPFTQLIGRAACEVGWEGSSSSRPSMQMDLISWPFRKTCNLKAYCKCIMHNCMRLCFTLCVRKATIHSRPDLSIG